MQSDLRHRYAQKLTETATRNNMNIYRKYCNRTQVLYLFLISQLTIAIFFGGHYFLTHTPVESRNAFKDEHHYDYSVRCDVEHKTFETDRLQDPLPVELPIPMIAHQILWDKTMTFRNYLSILSVWKILRPYQIKVYISKSFKTEEFVYNDWYQKAISRIPTLQIIKLDLLDKVQYSSAEELAAVKTVLAHNGGIYVNMNTIINSDLRSQLNNTFYARISSDLRISLLGLAQNSKIPEDISTKVTSKCVPAKLFTQSKICCSVTDEIFPVNIMHDNSSFGHLARQLFYGKSSMPVPSISFPPIPKIVHYVWFGTGHLDYSMYLSFISTQKFIKPVQVRIYVDTNNTSMYLKKMAEFSNVQIVYYGKLKTVFQTSVRAASHASDFLRADVLYRFGGMYIDWDVYWLKPIDDLVSKGYETISSLDYYDDMYPRKTYPDTINMGVLLSRPGSRFMSIWRDSFKQYSGRHHTWHAVENVYKLWEEHPDLLVVDIRLQIMCHELRCHPLWLDDYKVVKAHHEFDFKKDVYAVHFTAPTPDAFTSEKKVKESKGFFADMARHILEP